MKNSTPKLIAITDPQITEEKVLLNLPSVF